ncbi:UNVERIFIED_CONTAM: GATA transcription factor 5 [Sesamum latifolium]|uniref:GATA transcription factor 5 n=1 Tax=Sesamum latifolium TaxID=2727402 RepID=A0AAW2SFY9_9LAMI
MTSLVAPAPALPGGLVCDNSSTFLMTSPKRKNRRSKWKKPEENEQDKKKTCSVSQEEQTPPENSAFQQKTILGLCLKELSVPGNRKELKDDEILKREGAWRVWKWLSHFVEDSFSDYLRSPKIPPKPAEKRSDGEYRPGTTLFPHSIQTKARTKRARTGVRVWPVLSPSFAESSTSSSSSTSSTTSLSPQNPWAVQSQTGESFLGKPLQKKHKKKPADASASALRRQRGWGCSLGCSHCGVTKTPQWRPPGPGFETLCNACGVRYKSGRLLPEYRPACSPTFSSELHSNNHRKVLEMRRKKEVETEGAGLGLPPPVQSF